jgi:hypothetical protein
MQAILRNGFTIRHEHRMVTGATTRLYLAADDSNFRGRAKFGHHTVRKRPESPSGGATVKTLLALVVLVSTLTFTGCDQLTQTTEYKTPVVVTVDKEEFACSSGLTVRKDGETYTVTCMVSGVGMQTMLGVRKVIVTDYSGGFVPREAQ